MNKDMLVVINWYNENIEELKNAIDRVEEVFSNILVCNKGSNILNLSNINGIEITKYAFNYHLGTFGGLILTISIILFAFSTIIGGYYYGEIALKFLIKDLNTKLFKIIVLVLLLISTVISPTIIWNLIDKSIVILAIINTISLVMMRKEIFNIVKKYDKI